MRSLAKNSITYLGLSLFVFVGSLIYHLFSHGVTSSDMQSAYLWFLLSALIYGILLLVFPAFEKRAYYRLFMNLFNTASASQVLGLFLTGIIDIAGGSSAFLPLYFWMGKIFYGLSVVAFLFVLLPFNRPKKATETHVKRTS